jgi:hypothetical protein
MDKALEALKLRYGFVGFHLVGQSGGSKLVGGLIGLRSDIVCAVSGSGPLSEAASSEKGPPDRSYFDAADSISAAVKNPSLRLFVITDPMDRKVPVSQQTPYVQRMFREGGQVSQYFVQALGEDHHDTFEYSRLVAAGCILERSHEQIGRAIQTIELRNSDLNERRRRERTAQAHATPQLPSSLRSAPMGVVSRSQGTGA